ncbi:MAG: sialidase family protein [candidate division KSB1 bacterium]|nr:sialidase family protein [candidate division KSB1 bacterium]
MFKTTDGGKTWKKVLYVNETTGAADLVMDPRNPNKLFAAMWQHRRWPWFFQSGGPGSGLYVTYDGGETWKKLTDKDGLPKGELGRIGLAIARSNPDVVYALIEAKKNVLCRSDDGGRTWKIVNKSNNVAPRPFYFADIRVDPQNENRVYNLHNSITVSEDGGKTFKPLTRARIHPDHHALWIHPEDGSFMVNGNDGGVYISHDRGKTWRFVENLPLAQFYHINIDHQIPFKCVRRHAGQRLLARSQRCVGERRHPQLPLDGSRLR